MTTQRILLPLVLALVCHPFVSQRFVRPAQASAPDAQRLLATADAARETFTPVTDGDLSRARTELTESVARLEGRLARNGENGQAWAAYLRLAELRDQIRAPEIDVAALDAAHRRFDAGHYGLNRVWFADVRNALERTIQVARALQTPELDKAYAQYVETLASYLRRYVENPTAEQAVQIGEAIGWLESIGQAPALVAAVREELAQPNVRVAVSARLVTAGLDEPVDETEPVRDVILGTTIHGIGHTLGRVTANLVPNEEQAVIDLTYLGITRTRNTGYNGPVVIQSQGTTGIGARKRLWINESGLHSHPTQANATTDSVILDIQAQRASRIVERIAWRRAMEQKSQSEAIASQRAAARAGPRMDSRAAVPLADANRAFEQELRRPLREHNIYPRMLRFSSGADALRIVGLQAGPTQLAAIGSPPPAVERADLIVSIHQSMFNNALQTALTGLTTSDAEFRMAAEEILGEVPDQLQPIPGDEPWGITFDRAQPIEVRFVDGGFHVTLRGRRFFQGDQPHPAMNVSAIYRIVHDDSGFRAVREGDVDVVPPGLGEDQRLGTRHQVIRTLLIRRFDRIFEKEILVEDLVLPEGWEHLGPMPVVQFESNGGWLTMAWAMPGRP